MNQTDSVPTRVEAVRAFNRFYTRQIGVLQEGLLRSEFNLTESRLLWELAHRQQATATELARDLDLDPGYLSRLLRSLKERELVATARAADDARQQHLSLTTGGREAFAPLDERSRSDLTAMLQDLSDDQQQALIQSMARIESLLQPAASPASHQSFLLRNHRPGDMGWVVSRHGALYAREYGWDTGFEALVARITADFIDRFDPKREACWIAERNGFNIGSAFIVQARDEATLKALPGVAQLRMVLVEPSARGLGVGKRLVDECKRFARQANYDKIILWTNSILLAARGIYQRAGYRMVASEAHRSFGHDLVGETWEMMLT